MTSVVEQPAAVAVRWSGVGISELGDARAAAAAAARTALAGRTAALLLVGSSAGHDPEQIVAGLSGVAGNVPTIGGSVGGELSAAGSSVGHVTVVALGGAGFTARTGSAVVGEQGVGAAGQHAAACVDAVTGCPSQVLLLLSDPAAGDQQDMLRGAYRTAGAGVSLVGGVSVAAQGPGTAWQLHDGQVLRGAVVAAALGSDASFSVGVGHGWRPVGQPMLVTASTGNIVHELDDEPALQRYLQRLPAGPDLAAAVEGGEAFTRASGTHPLGLRRRSGPRIRRVIGALPEQGSIVCAAEVPQGALTWLMSGDVGSVLAGMEQACEQAIAGLDGAPPTGLLVFDCVARQRILGRAVEQEAALLDGYSAGAPYGGFYTAGEIARTQGLSGYHNMTVVVLAVG